jgi:glycosyltransferase involved in cell wall biosynthesis
MYNSESTIINSLNSVLNQTAIKFIIEVIVINDGSKDNSLKIVQDYADKNKQFPVIVINKSNGGVSSARNLGLSLAKGNWIALLDSDDEWLPKKIEYQFDLIKKVPDIFFLGGPFNNKKLKIFCREIKGLYKAKVSDICIKNFPQPSTVIFKKSIFYEIGGFDENQRYAEDGNFFVKICSKYNLYYDSKLLIRYDNGKRGYGQRGLSGDLKKMHIGNLKNLKEFRDKNIISKHFYVFLKYFYIAKYIRRIVVSKLKS